MAGGRSRRHSGDYGLFWPGYVDVLSTLLLVVTFLMSIFMLAQYFAQAAISCRRLSNASPRLYAASLLSATM